MSRRRGAIKKEILPDVIYNNVKVGKLVNYVMKNGEKAKAENIVYKAIKYLSDTINNKDPMQLFE